MRRNACLAVLILLNIAIAHGSYAGDVNAHTHISCISEDNSVLAKIAENDGPGRANKVRAWFGRWLFGENSTPFKSKVDFLWRPVTEHGPKIKIVTSEKPHNLVSLRSKTRESLIVVSSASSPMTTESWSFTLNFSLETMIATRVQSNLSGVRGEVLSYACDFEYVVPGIDGQDNTPLG